MAHARGAPGVYNIVDDDPAQAAELVPALARMLGAKARRQLRWSPVYASWRDGFGVDLKAASARAATRADESSGGLAVDAPRSGPDQTGPAGAWRMLEGDAAPVLAAAPLIDGFSVQLMGMRRDCSKLR